MGFIFKALNHSQFEHLYGLSDEDLKAKAVLSCIADESGLPCRVSLQGAIPGERVFLLNHTHLVTNSPYRASHAIFVREGAREKKLPVNEVPDYILNAYISLRAFDPDDMMIDYGHIDGARAKASIEHMLLTNNVKYIDVHFAGPGCFFVRVHRA